MNAQKCFLYVAGGASAISSTSPVQFPETAAAARRGDGDGGHGHCLTTPFHQRGATRERHVRHQAHLRVQGGALRAEGGRLTRLHSGGTDGQKHVHSVPWTGCAEDAKVSH
ncbi:uncharacterized protein TNCT_633281 [Trichonephila clavata]|uniref:Uncharacterized protein n=1 Tax=Trichonephila clavata TaxID=2740835 RepID=A0A8X6KHK0_TRICU|nr:uncharacterized protein TNCT_633281 [Trichonephila clavata]